MRKFLTSIALIALLAGNSFAGSFQGNPERLTTRNSSGTVYIEGDANTAESWRIKSDTSSDELLFEHFEPVTDANITLNEAKVTSVEAAGHTPTNKYFASVTTDSRSNQTTPAGINGDMTGKFIEYDGTVWLNFVDNWVEKGAFADSLTTDRLMARRTILKNTDPNDKSKHLPTPTDGTSIGSRNTSADGSGTEVISFTDKNGEFGHLVEMLHNTSSSALLNQMTGIKADDTMVGVPYEDSYIDGTTYTIGDEIIDQGVRYIANTTGIQTGLFSTNTAKWDAVSHVAGGVSGTATSGQVAVYNGTNSIGGSSGLTYNGTLLTSTATTDQLQLGYSASENVTFTVSSTGELTIFPNGTSADVVFAANISANALGAGHSSPSTIGAKMHSISSNEPLRLGFDTSNYAKFFVSSTGDLRITPTGGNLVARSDTALTNSVEDILKVSHQTSGMSVAGIGVGFEFEVDTAGAVTNLEIGAVIEAVTTDVTALSEDFDLVFKTMTAGAIATEKLRVNSLGNAGFGTGSTISARVHSLSTTEQLRLGYDAANYTTFTVNSSGGLTIDPTGDDITLNDSSLTVQSNRDTATQGIISAFSTAVPTSTTNPSFFFGRANSAGNRAQMQFVRQSDTTQNSIRLGFFGLDSLLVIQADGMLGINHNDPEAALHPIFTTEQLRLGYDGTNYASFTTGSTGDLTIAPTGGDTTLTGNLALTGDISTAGNLFQSTTTGSVILSGGSTALLGGNIVLYGEIHGTQSNDIELRSEADVKLMWDDSLGLWNFFDDIRISSDASVGPMVTFDRTDAIVTSGEIIGTTIYTADDPVADSIGATLRVEATDAWSANNFPSKFSFLLDNAGTLTEVGAWNNDGLTVTGDVSVSGNVVTDIYKESVVATTITNGVLATAYENADAIDGVTLTTGDRILLKEQTTGSENGIYTVNASGAPTRATDFDNGSEVLGSLVYTLQGTIYAGTSFRLNNSTTPTIGSTSLVFKDNNDVANLVNVHLASDLGSAVTAPDGISRVLLVGGTTYLFHNNITLPRLWIPPVESNVPTIVFTSINLNIVLFTAGDDTGHIWGRNMHALDIGRVSFLDSSFHATRLFDLVGSGENTVFVINTAVFINYKVIGSAKHFVTILTSMVFSNCLGGLVINTDIDNQTFRFVGFRAKNSSTSPTATTRPMLTFQGDPDSIVMTGSQFFLGSGDDLIELDNALAADVEIGNNSYTGTASGNFFQSSQVATLTAQAIADVAFASVESGGSGFSTFVFNAEQDWTIGQQVLIDGDVNTTYDGLQILTSVSDDQKSFTIEVTFVATDTGNFKMVQHTMSANPYTRDSTITLTGTTSYNATLNVLRETSTTFHLPQAFVANDATGTATSNPQNEASIGINALNNGAQKDSKAIGSFKALDNSTATVISTIDVWVDLNLNAGATVALNNSRHTLTNTTTGEMQYLDSNPINGNLMASISASSSGGSQEFEFRAVVNGSPLSDGIVSSVEIGSDTIAVPLTVPLSRVQNDLTRIQVRNIDGTSNIIIKNITVDMQ